MLENSKWLKFDTGLPVTPQDRHGNPSPYFRKAFSLKSQIKKATLKITALGVFKGYINGEELDSDMLLPGWVDYNKRIPVIFYDVTSRLKQNNAIAVVLGDGWYCGYLGLVFKGHIYGDAPQMCAELELEYYSGEKEYIYSDENWRASKGEILSNSLYLGEVIDKRCSLGNFSASDYDDTLWNFAEVTDSKSHLCEESIVENTKRNIVILPRLIHEEEQLLIYDFGQNMVGVVSATINGSYGDEVVFRHGEVCYSNGRVYTANLRAADATDYFVCSGVSESFLPLFTYHGFRYVEIKKNKNVKISDIKGMVVYNELASAGEFECSSELVNKIYSNALWSQRGNFISIPTDCPQRDERLGWTGDAQIFCGTAMFNMDCKKFYAKYLTDIRDAQKPNGSVSIVAPIMGFKGFHGIAAWGDAITVIPCEHYIMYGDKTILQDNIDSAKKWVAYCLEHSEQYLRPSNGYGDWLNVDEETDKGLISTAYFAYSSLLTARMCEWLGDAESENYYKLYQNIKTAFRKQYMLDESFGYKLTSDTQTAYLLSYMFGLISGVDVIFNLKMAVKNKNYHLTSGFIGVKLMLPALCELGLKDIAYQLITNTDYPSWGYTVVNGATTVWERWNSYTVNGGFSDTNMNSFNHYSFGSCVEWFYKYILGIMPSQTSDGVGFNKLTIKPYIDSSDKITSVSGSYITPHGKIIIKWEKIDYKLYKFYATVPSKIQCKFDFGDYLVKDSSLVNSQNIFLLKLQ